MIDVEIRNFQSIAKAHFQINGFTAVVGKSNIGKSAVVRALKCALTGAEGTNFVRHDPNSCARILKASKKCKCTTSVQIKFDNGDTLLWEKGDTANRYTTWVGGVQQEYSALGKSPELPPLIQGFEPVTVSSRKELVQVADQFTPLFLLDMSGPAVADLLSDVAQLDDINAAMRMVTKDRKEAASVRKVRDQDILDLEKAFSKYTGLGTVAHRVSGVEATYARIESVDVRLTRLSGFVARLIETIGLVKALQGVTETAIPETSGLVTLSDSHARVSTWESSVGGGSRAVVVLEAALQPNLPASAKLEALSQSFQKVSGFCDSLAARDPVVRRLSGVDGLTISPLDELATLQGKIRACSTWLDHLIEIKGAVQAHVALTAARLQPVSGLKDNLTDFSCVSSFSERWSSLEEDLLATETALEKARLDEEEAASAFAELGVCATCTRPYSPEGDSCQSE